MFQARTGKFALGGVLVLVTLILLLVFRGTLFPQGNERVNELLRLKRPVKVDNEMQSINSSELLLKYYQMFGYQQTWTNTTQQHKSYRDMLKAMLNQADSLGLNRQDYHEDYLTRYDSMARLSGFDPAPYESENELIFADAAISFLYHVAYGKELDQLRFNGVDYYIDSSRILNVFNELLVHQNWRQTLDRIEPKISQYVTLKRELNRMNNFIRRSSDIDSIPRSNKEQSKKAAIFKLQAYNLLPEIKSTDSIPEADFKAALKSFQRMVSLDTTAVLDKKTIDALSFPLKARAGQIKQSLNYWRWTGRLMEQEFILVNIPAARLQIVNRDSLRDLSMRVIVGKADTRTPSFTAYITKVITYPYWTVPFSIATKEMIPKIRRSLGYLEQNNLQVINNKGKEINPRSLNWWRYSKKYFPYTIRQSTGCDNSLGVLKFDLNSPFSIYLHDTNNRNLFANNNRYMSHGCVRVEKPMELAHFILEKGLDSTIVAKLDSCMKDQKPTDFKLKKKYPVLLLYMTADIDENNNLRFYKDIYALEQEVK